MSRNLGDISLCVLVSCLLAFAFLSQAQAQTNGRPRQLITQNIDESKLFILRGNTRPEALSANDRGIVANDFAMEHMLLQLRRSPEQEQALKAFLDDLQNPQSPNFHHWLTAEQFGEQFGLAQEDIDTITGWLESYGFRINLVYPSRILIDFSGTAGQVRQAFHTSIHQLDVHGTAHIANMRDPQIPVALSPAVVGIVSLHDFRPHPMVKVRSQYTFGNALTGTAEAVVPGDLATIYNFTPVFNSGITGQGQTIAIVEDTNLYSTGDWTTFRSTFGLSGYSGSLSQVHPAPPSGPSNCGDPGVNADDVEAILDAEYASAAAPSATIEMASCSDAQTTFGGLIAIQNMINGNAVPPVISVSYGECEAVNGAAANATYNAAYQQASTEGVSVYVAAGDSGAAGCDQNQSAAAHGIGVNAFASTPNNVAVGGTDFSDTYSGTNGNYWNSGNTPTYSSARSYIPETPWNDSCAGALLAAHEGFPVYGSNSFCNAAGGLLAMLTGTLTTGAGGGAPSGCATGSPSTEGVVSGSCTGYTKPSWQSLFGNPNDGVRDTPDVSLFAANGLWSHYYIFCYSDTANGGTACTGAPSGWSGAGGTSFAAPIMAGVQALVNQKTGGNQGNPNPTLYALAANEYGPTGSPSCNSSLGNAVSSSCIFYDVTLGDMAVDCTGTQNCYDSSTGYGVLSTSNSADVAAYGTATGWDFSSGIGTVNVANLVNGWPASSSTPDFSLSASPATASITQGGASGSVMIVAIPVGGFSDSISLSASGLPAGVTATFGTNPATNTSTLTLTASTAAVTGSVTVTVTGMSGDLTHTTSVALTVKPAPASLTITKTHVGNFTQGQQNATYTVTVSNGTNAGPTIGAVSVSETLPTGLSLVSIAGSGWSCTGSSCTRNDALNGGGSFPAIIVTVNVATNAMSPQVNQVSVSGGGSTSASVADPTTIVSPLGVAVGSFVGSDTVTQGTWHPVYGADGYSVANSSQTIPSYASFALQGQSNYTWASSTTDPRALQTGSGAGRIASTWYNSSTFSFDLNFTDGNSHQFALYALDWDTTARAETFQVVDANTAAVLDTRNISSFNNGIYLIWNLSGHVRITVTRTAGINAVVSGVFFGGKPSSAVAAFVGSDATTEGTWHPVYGAEGYSVANNSQTIPSYASFALQGQSNYTWASSTTDPRALQTGSGAGRIASTWYNSSTFSFDLNFTDGNSTSVRSLRCGLGQHSTVGNHSGCGCQHSSRAGYAQYFQFPQRSLSDLEPVGARADHCHLDRGNQCSGQRCILWRKAQSCRRRLHRI